MSGGSRWSQATSSAVAGQLREYLPQRDHPDVVSVEARDRRRRSRPRPGGSWETGVTAGVGEGPLDPGTQLRWLLLLPPAVAVRVCRPRTEALGPWWTWVSSET